MTPTLADRLAHRDANRFVGRERELAVFERLLTEDGPANVVLVHGPGGIGKSTLLREVARLAAVRGWSPWLVDGRELANDPDGLVAVFAAAREEHRPVVLVDTLEQVSALDGLLRQRLVPQLPAHAIVVLAGREPPGSEWLADGWEHVTRAMRLDPLSAAEGRALVEALGVVGEQTAQSLVDWSAGSPLALTLATEVARQEGRWDGRDLEQRPDLVERLVRRVVRAQVEDEHADVTAVAAIARVTTAAMLADVLPGTDPNVAYRWLRAQAIAEPVGDGVAMHDLVRRAVRAHLVMTRTDRERELRRRIADHLFARAAAGEPRLIVDLSELIVDPALRWGFGAGGGAELYADALRPGELDVLSDAVLARGSEAWWRPTRRLAELCPEHFVVARDAGGTLCGVAIAVTAANASPATLDDPFVGAWIAHARDNAGAEAIVWRDSLDLTTSERGDLGSRVLAVLNTAAVLRSGLANPGSFYLPINPVNAASMAFARESGSRRVPELDVDVGSVRHECHVIDFGPGGLLGAQRDRVYAELGLPRRTVMGDGRARAAAPAVTAGDVHEALRNLDRPSELAASSLAAAIGGANAAADVRALLVRAAADAFGAGAEETLMRDLVERAYVDHRTSHEQAAHELHVSRSTYFRRLRQATTRVSDYVLATLTTRASSP